MCEPVTFIQFLTNEHLLPTTFEGDRLRSEHHAMAWATPDEPYFVYCFRVGMPVEYGKTHSYNYVLIDTKGKFFQWRSSHSLEEIKKRIDHIVTEHPEN